jgi:hypothetical protein
MSPRARLHGRPVPCLKHLRVLGAPCVVQVLTPLLPRGQQGILVGYMSDGRDKAAVYRVYMYIPEFVIPEHNKIVQSMTIHVDERPLDLGSVPSSLPAGNDQHQQLLILDQLRRNQI